MMLVLFSSCLVFTAAAAPPAPTLTNGSATPLWEKGRVPGELPDHPFGPESHTFKYPDDEHITNVDMPTLTPLLAQHSTGAAVIVAPGGGYSKLAWDKEGVDIARWLNSLNISALILKYRVPERTWLPFGGAPLMDVQRAMGLARANAKALGIGKLGFIGFSAGGHLTAHLSSTSSADLPSSASQRSYPKVDSADDESCMPEFSLLIYPWKLVDDATLRTLTLNITSDHPPSFLNQAEDDPIHMENALFYYHGLKVAKAAPSELHIYPTGGHGYGRCTVGPSKGMGDEVCTWPDRAALFLKRRQMATQSERNPAQDGAAAAVAGLQDMVVEIHV